MTFKKPFEIDSNNIPEEGINFFKELYTIMKTYNIHRIYTASLDEKKIVVAQQLLSVTITHNNFIDRFYSWLDKYFPTIYFNICFKIHIIKYKVRLKRLFNKYGVEKIKSNSFNLYQGINVANNSLCIREIDLVFKAGNVVRINNLYLDI